MKTQLFKYSFVVMIMLIGFTSCEDDLISSYNENYVAFTASSTSVNESVGVSTADGSSVFIGGNYTINIFRSASDFNSSLTVNISVSAKYLSDTQFADAGDDASDQFKLGSEISSITFAPGEVSKKIVFSAIHDIFSNGDKLVEFTISSVSDNSYNVGSGASAINKKLSITIIDDDCPIDLVNDWEGEYEVRSFCAAPGSFNAGFCLGAQVGKIVIFEADPADPAGVTAILSEGIFLDPMPLKFITCTEEVSMIPGTYRLTFNQSGFTATVRPTDEPGKYGTGVYEDASKSINIVVTYSNLNNANFDEFIIELRKK